jgi:hypothetical protein
MKIKKWHVVCSLIIIVPVISGLVVGVLYMVWRIGSQPPESSIRDAIPTFVEATAEVHINQPMMIGMNSGSLVLNPGEVSLFIPANALSRMGQISITPREADLLAEAGEPGWRRPYIYNVEVKDSFGALIDVAVNGFVEVCFVMDEGMWTDFQNSSGKYQIQLYDESQSPPRWVPLQMQVYPYRQQVCGIASGFSLFCLAYQEPATSTLEPLSPQKMTETPTGTGTPGVYEP